MNPGTMWSNIKEIAWACRLWLHINSQLTMLQPRFSLSSNAIQALPSPSASLSPFSGSERQRCGHSECHLPGSSPERKLQIGVRPFHRQSSTRALETLSFSLTVFAQIGITGNRGSSSDYDDDMTRAKAIGIDAFALNIATGQENQVQFAYDSAAAKGLKAFISFDCNFYQPGSEGTIGSTISRFASHPAQLRVNNKVFVSTFIGDNLNVNAIRSAAGVDIYFAPNFHPGAADFGPLDGALNWGAWQSNGRNKAPSDGVLVTVQSGDQAYRSSLNGKGYIARE